MLHGRSAKEVEESLPSANTGSLITARRIRTPGRPLLLIRRLLDSAQDQVVLGSAAVDAKGRGLRLDFSFSTVSLGAEQVGEMTSGSSLIVQR